ncbi:acetate kinase [Leptodesmis sp.]|uniref:acetate kinase n=1 Tax=Leptodesmis sp. TaxID=3100501 RepID=UPI00405354E1
MKILVLNAGSSSQKSCLYDLPDDRLPEDPLEPVWDGFVDWTHHQGFAEVRVKTAAGTVLKEEIQTTDKPALVQHLMNTLWQGETQVIAEPGEIVAVGHRVVHGGDKYQERVRITPAVKAAIAELAVFAPVHNPANLEGIETTEQILGPTVPQIAVFDTAFHAHLPPPAYTYPIPYRYLEQGIRRYGFHGISHQYCAHRAAQLLGRNLQDLHLITCHLGNGCSLAAIQNGVSIDTTMGFTPLEGVMMGSRSGSIDPGILIHLLRQENYTAEELDKLLNRASGLQGVSGVSADLRQVMSAIADGNQQAKLAFDVYIHRLRAGIGSMLASLGGLDALVFTAGVGENSAPVRAAACQNLAFLGLKLDSDKNNSHPVDQDIAAPDSTIRVLVIHTQEDWAIAQECWRLVTSDLPMIHNHLR